MQFWKPFLRMRVLLPLIVLGYAGAGLLGMAWPSASYALFVVSAAIGALAAFRAPFWADRLVEDANDRQAIKGIAQIALWFFVLHALTNIALLAFSPAVNLYWVQLAIIAFWALVTFVYVTDWSRKHGRVSTGEAHHYEHR